MADVLTAEERRLIDAFPKRRIQRIARGVSGLPEYTYVPTSTYSGKLVGTRTAKEVVEASHRVRKRGIQFRALKDRERKAAKPAPAPKLVMVSPPTKAPKPKRERKPREKVCRATGAMAAKVAAGMEKRERVRVLILSGMTYAEVAKDLGCHKSMVAANVRALRDSGELPPKAERKERAPVTRQRDAIAARREAVLGMVGRMTQPAIAAELGVSLRMVESDVRALRKAGRMARRAA